MHYYQFNIGDYRRETTHLSLLEHGVYRSLLDTYILTEKPLCADKAKLMRSHCIRSEEEKLALENVLEDFFSLSDDGYHNEICDSLISKYQEKSEKARQSAQARWAKKASEEQEECDVDANALQTDCECYANHKPITNNQEPTIKEKEQGASPMAKARIASIDYQEVANRYNAFADRHKDVPGVSNADRWTAARKNKVRDLFILNKDKWLVDGSWEYGFFDRYLNAVERYGGWMLERRNKGNGEQWQAKNIDYLVSRKCEQAIRDAIRDVDHAD